MNKNRRVLIFSTVWPESQSSAAGVRLMQWVNLFLKWGYLVTLSSPSLLKNKQEWGYFDPPDGCSLLPLPLNQSGTFEQIKNLDPAIVLFDRFILEEQFGHQVYAACPEALILLETQDLHFVRRARETSRELKPQYQTDTALRETAAMMRVDFSFVVSSYEAELLKTEFMMTSEMVKWIPFFYDEPVIESSSAWQPHAFSERSGFCFVGNFRHAPNVDGLRWFRKDIWPLLRQALPPATVSVCGAYPSAEVMQWNDVKTGFLVKGHAEELSQVFDSRVGLAPRVNLAPLQFGAGIKGKILEGFRYGVPMITTPVGIEGLADFEFAKNSVASTDEDFAKKCIELHENEKKWREAQIAGRELMQNTYALAKQEPQLKKLFENLLIQKQKGKLPRWISKILRREDVNSHLYFSRWIELKERK